MNLEVNNTFYDKRQVLFLKKFNKNYSDLDKENTNGMKQNVPMTYIWDYSISHFNEIIEEDGNLFGLRIK